MFSFHFYRHGHNVRVCHQSAGLSTQPALPYVITHNDTPKPVETRAGIQPHNVGASDNNLVEKETTRVGIFKEDVFI